MNVNLNKMNKTNDHNIQIVFKKQKSYKQSKGVKYVSRGY